MAPGLEAPISVLPLTRSGSNDGDTSHIELELFVDQQICELFLHDGRGRGSAAVTFGCAPKSDAATGLAVIAEGVEGATMSGKLSDMADSILPPPPVESK